MGTRVGELGERALVRWLRERLLRPHVALVLGIGDDGAVLALPGHVVATVDAVTAGVDWLPERTPRPAVGHRAAAVNLSDLAAMGATPACLLLSLQLPPSLPFEDLRAAVEGLCALCDEHDVVVAGGDVGMGEGPEHWSVTALGQLDGEPLRRDAARPGDAIWLVGEVGAAAVGLASLRAGGEPGPLGACVAAHLWPQPRLSAGRALQASGARVAAIDVSDGLWLDGTRLAEASGVSLDVELDRPAWCDDDAARACARLGVDWRRACAAGGDDYALLVATSPELDLAGLLADAPPPGGGAPARRIGQVREGAGVRLRVGGREMAGEARGYLHGA